ncbi:MAG TPA: hypothetical protein VLK28_09380 [Methylomirabilota bacterium]|nr:hypothetical protein [Methylomirabilota bacterium]
MTAEIIRPVVLAGVLLAAAGYLATKEWQWRVDVPLAPAAEVWPAAPPAEAAGPGPTEAVTVRPEQIFLD